MDNTKLICFYYFIGLVLIILYMSPIQYSFLFSLLLKLSILGLFVYLVMLNLKQVTNLHQYKDQSNRDDIYKQLDYNISITYFFISLLVLLLLFMSARFIGFNI
jgi:hypothetical protein